MSKLCTDAWLLLGISSIPGELMLRADHVTFTAHSTGSAWPWQLKRLERRIASPGIAAAIDAGKRTVVVRWPIREIQAWCPWYYFGSGIKISRSNTTLRISFGEPANMKIRSGGDNPGEALREAAAGLDEVGRMRRRGKLWQAALQEHARADPT